MDDEARKKEAWEAYQKHLRSHAVALVVTTSNPAILDADEDGDVVRLDAELAERGSGVLVKFKGAYFVATCAHLFSKFRGKNFLVAVISRPGEQPFELDDFLGPSEVKFKTIGNQLPGHWKADSNDLALIRVTQDMVQGRYFYPVVERPVALEDKGNWITAVGYPGEFGFGDASKGFLHVGAGSITVSATLCFEPEYEETDGSLRPVKLFKGTIQSTKYIVNDEVREFPESLGGASGGGVWKQRRDGMPELIGLFLGEDTTSLHGVSIDCWIAWADSIVEQNPDTE